MTESRIARRRKKQGPLPQRILDLMKDEDPNEINQGTNIHQRKFYLSLLLTKKFNGVATTYVHSIIRFY